MSDNDTFISQLEDCLETFDGVAPLPDRIHDAVMASVSVTQQAAVLPNSALISELVSHIPRPMRSIAGATAVLAIVLVAGVAMLGGQRLPAGIGTLPNSPSPRPLMTPSAASSQPPAQVPRITEATPTSCGVGVADWCLAAGTYSLSNDVWPGSLTLEAPAGWFSFQAGDDYEGLLVESGSDAANGSGWGLVFLRVGAVRADPCLSSAGDLSIEQTATVDGLVAAMSSWPGFEATQPVPLEMSGFRGLQFELVAVDTPAECTAGMIWVTPAGALVDAYPMVGPGNAPHPGTFRVLDVDGTVVVIRSTEFTGPSPFEVGQGVVPDPNRHAADLMELQAIIESIRLEP